MNKVLVAATGTRKRTGTMELPINDRKFGQKLTDTKEHLRPFALKLCRNATQADDLVQETMLKAWKSRDSYKPGTNIKAWAFTILRNHFYSVKRRSWRRQPLDPEVAEATLVGKDNSTDRLDLLAVRNAMHKLSDDQREALTLVGAGGMSYEDAADICDCAIGTVKSRVSRARSNLEGLMDDNSASMFSEDGLHASHVFEEILEDVESIRLSA